METSRETRHLLLRRLPGRAPPKRDNLRNLDSLRTIRESRSKARPKRNASRSEARFGGLRAPHNAGYVRDSTRGRRRLVVHASRFRLKNPARTRTTTVECENDDNRHEKGRRECVCARTENASRQRSRRGEKERERGSFFLTKRAETETNPGECYRLADTEQSGGHFLKRQNTGTKGARAVKGEIVIAAFHVSHNDGRARETAASWRETNGLRCCRNSRAGPLSSAGDLGMGRKLLPVQRHSWIKAPTGRVAHTRKLHGSCSSDRSVPPERQEHHKKRA